MASLLGGMGGGGGGSSSFTPAVSPRMAGDLTQNQYNDYGMGNSLPAMTDVGEAMNNANLTNLQAFQNFNLANLAQQNALAGQQGQAAADLQSLSNMPNTLGQSFNIG